MKEFVFLVSPPFPTFRSLNKAKTVTTNKFTKMGITDTDYTGTNVLSNFMRGYAVGVATCGILTAFFLRKYLQILLA